MPVFSPHQLPLDRFPGVVLGSCVMDTPTQTDSGKVGPSSWSGEGNPLTNPDVEVSRRGPGRPRKDRTEAPPASTTVAGVGAGQDPARPGRRRKMSPRPKADEQIAFAAHPPESLAPLPRTPNLNEVRLMAMQEHAGEWTRLRVLASKSGASDIARHVQKGVKGEGKFAEAFVKPGTVDVRVVTTNLGFEIWALFTET